MMKKLLLACAVCSILSFSFFFSSPMINPVYATETPKNYVITFQENTSQAAMEAALQAKNLQASKMFGDLGMAVVKTTNETAVQELKQNPSVIAVELEATVSIPQPLVAQSATSPEVSSLSTPPSFTDPLYASLQWHIRRVRADKAWEQGYTASHDTVVGIVDTGIASNHPELGPNIVYEKCFTSFQPTCDPYPQFPGAGTHGTAMAGIVGSLINGVGVIGVSPNVGLANLNVSEIGPDGIPTVFDSSIWAAIQDAADHHFDVLNFSFEEILQKPLSEEDQQRVQNWRRVVKRAHKKGVTMIASAGNDGIDLSDTDVISVPCELPEVYCAGATNIRPQPTFPQVGFFDEAAFYTNYGKKAVDIAAPGGDCGGPDFQTCVTTPDPRYFVWTTSVAADAVCALTHSCPTAFTASIGTSFSAPHTAGVAALIIDIYKHETGHRLKPDQVEKILTKSAEDLPDIPQLGAGMVNAEEAVEKVLDLIH